MLADQDGQQAVIPVRLADRAVPDGAMQHQTKIRGFAASRMALRLRSSTIDGRMSIFLIETH